MGVIGWKGGDDINLSNFKYGDKYMSIIGEVLNHIPEIRKYKFSHNRISSQGASVILSNIC